MTARQKRRQLIGAWIWEYKKVHPCIECGQAHPAALQFHHREPSDKEISIANAVGNGWSISRLEREVEKCDILCANCHAILHYEQEPRHGI